MSIMQHKQRSLVNSGKNFISTQSAVLVWSMPLFLKHSGEDFGSKECIQKRYQVSAQMKVISVCPSALDLFAERGM
jgi:hypothetical protein